MAEDARLVARLSLDSRQYTQAVSQAARSTEESASRITKSQQNIAKGFAQVGLAAGVAGGLIVTAFLVKATKVFISFEHSITRTAAIMKMTVDQIKPIEDEILKVAAASSYTATQVGEAAQVLALAGLSMEEMVDDKAIETLTAFAIAAGVDVETAAGIGIASTKSFRLAITQLDEVANVLTNTFTSSFVTIETLGMAMKFLGPTASAAGVSIAEAAAAVGALGNAGLQGTIAGTGMRMAINKLLTPADEARRVIERLGLQVVVLTPAGQEAQIALTSVGRSMDSLKIEASKTIAELDILEGRLSDLSIEQQKNSITIQRIRQRAARQGRDLTDEELKQIKRLESANTELSISQQEAGLESMILRRTQKKQNEVISAQKKEYNSLREIVENQTQGITGLVDVMDQLTASGATTSEILKIFGVRGGTAVLALMSQVDAFRELADANQDAYEAIQGTGTILETFSGTIQSDTQYALDEIRSNFEDAFIAIGREFAPLIKDGGMLREALINIAQALKSNAPDFAEFAEMLAEDIVPIFHKLPGLIDDVTNAFAAMAPIIRFIGNVVKLLLWVLNGILAIISEIVDGVQFIITKAGELGSAFGIGSESATADAADSIGGVVQQTTIGAATGATIGATLGLLGGPFAPITVSGGAAVGGVIGAVAGGLGEVGNQAGLFHEGGIATSPTPGVFGESGAEALLPLTDRRAMEMVGNAIGGKSGRGDKVMNFHFGSITINGTPDLTANMVRDMIERTLPGIVKSSLLRGSRGAI